MGGRGLPHSVRIVHWYHRSHWPTLDDYLLLDARISALVVQQPVGQEERFDFGLPQIRLCHRHVNRAVYRLEPLQQQPDVSWVRERRGRDVVHCPYCHGWEVRDKAIGVLATRPAAVHMAVPQVSSFVDRRLEITEVRQLLARSRVVTLCGLVRPRWDLQKRLAVAVAEVALSEYPDGIWFVELASHGDAAFVASTIAGC